MLTSKDLIGFISALFILAAILLAPVADAQTFYTGVVIDARGLGLLPSMSPKIYDATGNEVYGTMVVDPEFVIEKGIAGFAESVDAAIEEGIVGNNPIVVKAISLADDPSLGSVVVHELDAAKILKANEKAAFLSAYRVAIIM